MKAEQVLDMQQDLLERLVDDPDFSALLWHSRLLDNDPMATRADALALGGHTARVVEAAYAYRVSEDMSVLTHHAANSLDRSDKFDPSLAPTGCGLARFDKPLPVQDVNGRQQKIHWLLWGPGPGGTTLLYAFNDHLDPDDSSARYLRDAESQEMVSRLGRWGAVHGWLQRPGVSVGRTLVDPPDSDRHYVEAAKMPVFQQTNVVRYVHAFWLLVGQTVSDPREEHVRKTARRQAERAGLPGRVTVVQLRRSEGNRGSGESTVEWTHRWVVRGHWRWQPYGPGRQERRRIWIAPFVKGPDGTPLVVSDKVYDVNR